jgi:ribosome maturation factor RimP
VAVRTDGEVGGRKRFRGDVVDTGEREVTLLVGGEQVQIPYESIVRSNLIEEGGKR